MVFLYRKITKSGHFLIAHGCVESYNATVADSFHPADSDPDFIVEDVAGSVFGPGVPRAEKQVPNFCTISTNYGIPENVPRAENQVTVVLNKFY